MPSLHPAVFIAVVATFLIVICGGDSVAPTIEPPQTGEPPQTEPAEVTQEPPAPPLWRYVNSGWVSPLDESANAFARELRADVITSSEELERFNRTIISKRTVGTGTTLNRAEFPGSVLLVAYLLWLPVQGDPLSVVGLNIKGNRAIVDLEIDEDAQGREYPYLFAPMTMVTVDRDEFPAAGPVVFEFRLGDDLLVTLSDTLE